MANQDHLAKLKEGVNAWNEWKRNTGTHPDLGKADLGGENLAGVDFSQTNLTEADLSDADLSKARLRSANLHKADLRGATLDDAHLYNVQFQGARLEGATLHRADIGHAQFQEATLTDADLRGARANSNTNLQNADVTGCHIDRFTLEQMSNYGHLSNGQRMTMVIHDPVTTLRAAYSGFMQWIHIAAIAADTPPSGAESRPESPGKALTSPKRISARGPR